jgi:hypothetical protein
MKLRNDWRMPWMTEFKEGDLFKFEVLQINKIRGEERQERYVPRYIPVFVGAYNPPTGEHDNREKLLTYGTCSFSYEDVEYLGSEEKIGKVLDIKEDMGYAVYEWNNPKGCGPRTSRETNCFMLDSEHFKKVK